MLFELRKGLFDALQTKHSAIFFIEAPADQVMPYFVISSVTSSVRWDTVTKDDEVYVQINGYEKDLQELEELREEIRALLDNNPGAVTLDAPYLVYDISEQLNRVAKLGDVWQFTLQFKITIQKT